MNEANRVLLGKTAVYGVSEAGGLISFRGIPFAKAERWQKPETVNLTGETYDASEFGPAPVQGPPAPFFAKRSGELINVPYGEDCLNINIWTGNLKKEKKPVLFWVYGGAYIAGYNYRKGFTPENFVRRHPEIIVVAPNYRVGVLGSLNLSGLTNDPVYEKSNNLALLDILEGLRWVQRNIEAFGGDPDKVTVYGHSAGSNAITHLMVMPLAKGLFKRAICQSSFMTDTGSVAYETSCEIGNKFFEVAGVETLKEALALSPEEILAAQKQLFRFSFSGKPFKLFSPVEDGKVVQKDGFRNYVEGTFHAEQLMIGGSEGEYDQNFWDKTVDETRAAVIEKNRDKSVTEKDMEEYIKLFPERDEKESCLSVNNGLGLTLGGEWIARAAAKHCPVYNYQFKLRTDGGEHRALHGDPTYYVFGTLIDPQAPPELMGKMMDAWAAFAETGNPNHSEIPEWLETSRKHTVMVIDREWEAIPEYFERDFTFWFERFGEKRYVNNTII